MLKLDNPAQTRSLASTLASIGSLSDAEFRELTRKKFGF
jgi:hypothetical protein